MTLKMTLIGLITAFGIATASAQAQDPIRIATEGAYPPFNQINAEGNLEGFDVDIANALCAAMERECTLVAQDWDGIIPALVAGEYDLIVASMSITPERDKTIDFSDPYYRTFLSFIGKDGSKLDPMKPEGAAIGAQRSTVGSQWLEDNLGRRADIKLYDTYTAAYADLEAGRVEAVIGDYLPLKDQADKSEGVTLLGEPIDINGEIGIGVREGEDELRMMVNKAIKAIRADGTYQEISKRYFGVDIY